MSNEQAGGQRRLGYVGTTYLNVQWTLDAPNPGWLIFACTFISPSIGLSDDFIRRGFLSALFAGIADIDAKAGLFPPVA